MSSPPDAEEASRILRSLGQLALAASQAESYAAQGLFYLLADTPGDAEGAARVSNELRSFDALYRLLSIALRGDAPLADVLSAAKADAQARNARGEPKLVSVMAEIAAGVADHEYVSTFASNNPRATALGYLNKVKALYDKRNECVHALGIEVLDGEPHLYKRQKDGGKLMVNAEFLMEPCQLLRYHRGTTLARAIEAVAIELAMAALSLTILPVAVQWFRRRGTALDLAPLVDHYVELALAPLNEQIRLVQETTTILQGKLDAYHASKGPPSCGT